MKQIRVMFWPMRLEFREVRVSKVGPRHGLKDRDINRRIYGSIFSPFNIKF